MAKPTPTQLRALRTLAEHPRNDGWLCGPPGSRPTMRALRLAGLVEAQHDGGRYIAHRITDAGRAALTTSGGN